MDQHGDLKNRLIYAVRENNHDAAKIQLESQRDVNLGSFGYFLIQIAVRRGNKKLCELLLKFGAEVNDPDRRKGPLRGEVPFQFGKTTSQYRKILSQRESLKGCTSFSGVEPLQSKEYPCVKESFQRLKVTDHRFDKFEHTVCERVRDTFTPIFIAIQKGNKDICQLLLKCGAHINFLNSYGESPLYAALILNQFDIAELLLISNADINMKIKDGISLIHAAAFYQNERMFEWLLKHDAKIDKSIIQKNNDILRNAVKSESKLLLEYILKYCFIVKEDFSDLLSAAMTKSFRDNQNIFECMIKTGFYRTEIESYRKQLVNNSEIVMRLINYGFHINANDIHKPEVVLFSIAHKGCYEIFQQLFCYNLDVKTEFNSTNFKIRFSGHLGGASRGGNSFPVRYQWAGLDCNVFHIAVKFCNKDVLHFLISQGVDISRVDEEKRPPLYYAIQRKDLEITDLILQNINVNRFSKCFNIAVWLGFVEIVDIFIKHGYNLMIYGEQALYYTVDDDDRFVSKPNDFTRGEMAKCLLSNMPGIKPKLLQDILLAAVKGNYPNVAKALLQFGANANHVYPELSELSNDDQTIAKMRRKDLEHYPKKPRSGLLHFAVENRSATEIVAMLLEWKANVDFQNERGLTALHIVASKGHFSLAEILLNNHASTTCKDLYGNTALHKAALMGNSKTAKMLIEYGADIHCTDKYGETALHVTTCEETAELLLKSGAIVDCENTEGLTPLQLAISSEYDVCRDSIVEILIKHGASTNRVDRKGRTPLHIAVAYGDLKMAYLFLKNGANIHSKDEDGMTALHIATNGATIEFLLKSGACVNSQNTKGATPLHTAISKAYLDFCGDVGILLKYGASATWEDDNGTTPLELAIFERKIDIFKLLLEHSFNVGSRTRNNETLFSCIEKLPGDCYNLNSDSRSGMIRILQHQIVKLAIGNLPLNEAYLKSATDFVSTDFREKCQREILVMKEHYISNLSITFYDVLTKSVSYLLPYLRNEAFLTEITGDWDLKYPIYQSLVKAKLIQTDRRRKHLEDMEPLFEAIFPMIPDLCKQKIKSYFTNDDLAKLACGFVCSLNENQPL